MTVPDTERLLSLIRGQRWYAGRHREAVGASIVGSVPLGPPEQDTVAATIVKIAYATGDPELYFAPGLTRTDEEVTGALWHALVAPPPGLQATMLESVPPRPTTMRPLTGEQSNSSVLVDDRWVVKTIRRLEQGTNPEVEIGAALRERGATRVAPFVGALRITVAGGEFDVMTVHRRMAGTDGFALALADAQAERAGERASHFPGAAYELGIALGALHDELAEAFGTRAVGRDLVVDRLRRRLATAVEIEELAPYTSAIRERYDRVAANQEPLTLQRIHGDLHLGQTLFGAQGWVFLDFEGEPREPLAERRAPSLPMRDVAGILRSFDYAGLWDAAEADVAAGESWRDRSAQLFLEGYELQRGERVDHDLLEVLELDKAVYEVGYEAAHRPERVAIPLRAVRRLLGDREPLR